MIPKESSRIAYLDGLRGLAIILVICFHAFARGSSNLPYGNDFSILIFQKGYLGVELFFLISGFVILMTLEKCKSFKEFLTKRWLRLFPAMLIACILIFFTSNYLYERPAGIHPIKDIIPGLTFIQTDFWSRVTGISFSDIEGSFWSLYVEVKFYILFGLMFFKMGKKTAINVLSILFILGYFVYLLRNTLNFNFMHLPGALNFILNYLLDTKWYGWFAAGSLFYEYFRTDKKTTLIYGFIISVLSTFSVPRFDTITFVSCIVIISIFVIPLVYKNTRFIFESTVFSFFGLISYPLYLIHENAMVALIIKINKFLPGMPKIMLPVFPIILLMVISFMIVKYGEHFIRNMLKQIPFFKLENKVPVKPV